MNNQRLPGDDSSPRVVQLHTGASVLSCPAGLGAGCVEHRALPDLVKDVYGGVDIPLAAIQEAVEEVLVVHPAQRPGRFLRRRERADEARFEPSLIRAAITATTLST